MRKSCVPPCVLCETKFDTPGQTRPFRLISSTEEIEIAEQRVFIHFKYLQRERITLRNCVNKHWCHAFRLLLTDISFVTTAFIRDSLRNRFGKHPTIMKSVVSETLARLGVDAPPHLLVVSCEEQSSQHLLLREFVEIYVKHRREQTDLNAPASILGRTLMRFGFSHLAAEGVHAACGSRKAGHVFYAPPNVAAPQRFVQLREESAENLDSGATKLSMADEEALLRELGKRFRKMAEKYNTGKWTLMEEIAAAPRALWARRLLLRASWRKKSIWGRNVRATNEASFPVSNEDVPDPTEMEPGVARLVLQTFYQLEQEVYTASFHRAPGPFTLSLGVLSLTELTKNMHTMFNRVGGCVSYKFATSLREILATEYGEDMFRRHYWKIPDNNIMFAAMDNLKWTIVTALSIQVLLQSALMGLLHRPSDFKMNRNSL